jgi:tetratricopeptide (TPR) repeat protein
LTTFDSPLPSADLATANSSAIGGSGFARRLFLVLGAMALLYAFLAGLRTVSDPDLGWQMASGRWVAKHHHIFSTDVFSYTSDGEPWIYPAGSGLIFYAAYLLGGFALISWLGAAACVGTVALLLRRGNIVSAAIAILTVPLIASRTTPRAEMFTVVLFAAYLSLLWENYQTGKAALWLLPLLMVVWVNLHLGFVAGLGLVAAFVGVELLELPSSEIRRREALQRLKRALPWYAVTAIATLVNPWGWGLYQALVRQNEAMELHSHFIAEWARAGWKWGNPLSNFSLRDTNETFNLLLLIVVIAVVSAFLQRRPAAAILLIGAMYETTRHVRMAALTGCVVVVVAGSVLYTTIPWVRSRIPVRRTRLILGVAAVVFFAALALLRSADLVTNHHYLADKSISTFGPGLTWWFPQGGAEFIERENLPGQIFNTYNEGGYFTWKLGAQHRDYIDGRAIPFGPTVLQHENQLLGASLDSPQWQQEADRYDINTILFPLGNEIPFARLKDLCNSRDWRPVYLDEVSMVFVRRKPETEDLIRRLEVNCATAAIPRERLPISAASFDQWTNAASILAALGRNAEALTAANTALSIFPDSASTHWIRGNIFYAMDQRADAEKEWKTSLALTPGEGIVWSSLADLYQREQRIPEAMHALQEAIKSPSDASTKPLALVKLARLYFVTGQPKAALQALDEAVHSAPPELLAATEGRSFRFDVAQGRSAILRSQGDLAQATSYEEEAVQLDPEAADAWSHLAKLYERQGRVADQQRAEAKAAALAGNQSH